MATTRSGRKKSRSTFEIQITNTTGWSRLKEQLSRSSAQIVLGIETWVVADEVQDSRDWCRRAGWKTLFSPATPTTGRFRSGGVAAAARSHIGIGPAVDPPPDHGGRRLAAHVDAIAKGGIVIYPIYLHDREGLSDRNVDIVREVAGHIAGHGRPWVAGGDWNIPAQEMMQSSLLDELKGVVVSAGAPTFFGGEQGESSAEYDYFSVDRRIANIFFLPRGRP